MIDLKNMINLTPHTVNLYTTIGCDTTCGDEACYQAAGHHPIVMKISSSGEARVKTSSTIVEEQKVENIGDIGITIFRTEFGDVEGLPEPVEGVRYIVSRLVISALPERNDLIAPHDLVRDDEGRIIGCRSFNL